MRTKKALFFATLSVAALAMAGCGASPNAPQSDEGDSPSELVFAAVPSEDSQDLEASFAPVVAALEEELGIPVRFEGVSSNAGVIEAQVAERVDIAVYGAFSYYLASDVAEVIPVAVDERAPGADPSIAAYGIVRTGDGVADIADAGGQTVCFTDPASSTGYLAPAAGLLEAGVDPETDITPVYAGGHDGSVLALLAGDCQLAFAAQAFVDEILPAQGELEPGDVDIIWESAPIPGPPIVVGGWLDADLQQQIADALTKYDAVTAAAAGFCDGDEVPAPDAWGEFAGEPSCKWGASQAFSFIPTDAAAYEPIAEICEVTQAEVCREDG
jgi:phosphonate transport system substrate-binding protein